MPVPENKIPEETPTNEETLLEAMLEDNSEKMEENNSMLETVVEQNSENQTIQEAQLEVQNDTKEAVQGTAAAINNLKPEFQRMAEMADFIGAFLAKIKGEKGDKGDNGEKGDTPIFGTDYFTNEQIQKISDDIQSRIRVPEDGKDGYTPILGKDFFTKEQIQEMIDYIQKNVKDGKDGIDGMDAKVDYEYIFKEVLNRVKIPKQKILTEKEILESLKGKFSYNDLKDKPERFFSEQSGGGGGISQIFVGSGNGIEGAGASDDPLRLDIVHDDTLDGKGTLADPLRVAEDKSIIYAIALG